MQQQDRNIIEKLQQHTVAPPASVWNAIEKDLPTGASRSRRLMWFFGSLLTVLVLALVFWSLSGEDTMETQNMSAQNQIDKVQENVALTNRTIGEKETIVSELNSKNLTQTESKETPLTRNKTKGLRLENTSGQKGITESLAPKSSNQINSADLNEQIHTSSSTFSDEERLNQAQAVVMQTEYDNQITTEERTQKTESIHSSSELSMSDLLEERSNHRTLAQLLSPEVEELHKEESEDWIGYRRKARMLNPCTYIYDQTCYDFGGGPPGESKVYLDFVGGPDFYNRTLRDRSTNGEFIDYADARNDSETSELSWSIMARASLVTESGLAIRAGFLYQQTHERFEASRRVTMITQDTIGGIPRVDTISGTNTVTIYNKLKYLELPFMLGYEYSQDRMSLGINAGAALGLSFTQRGRILSPADDIVSITSNDNNRFPVYSGQAGLNLIGSFTFGYELTPRVQWIVEPNFRYRLGSVTIDSYPLEQKYSSFGLWTGVRLRL